MARTNDPFTDAMAQAYHASEVEHDKAKANGILREALAAGKFSRELAEQKREEYNRVVVGRSQFRLGSVSHGCHITKVFSDLLTAALAEP